ncbi:hypothetical protein RJ641_000148 [Dillenia turbinata]|uniref:Uncharacterized protein n=1 Tax=Dillenia turbinata TaxID=194707 RepID=A0AAN8W7I4_9MAGN
MLVSFYLDERPLIPLPLSKAATMIKNLIVSLLEKQKVKSDSCWSHLDELIQETDLVKDIVRNISGFNLVISDTSVLDSDAIYGGDDDESVICQKGVCTSLLQPISHASGAKSGFRILIAGSPRSDQKHLASCLLHCFVGNVEIRMVDLATISQEGHGDAFQGVAQILSMFTDLLLFILIPDIVDSVCFVPNDVRFRANNASYLLLLCQTAGPASAVIPVPLVVTSSLQWTRTEKVVPLDHIITALFAWKGCAGAGSCLVFMPRIDLWAIKTQDQIDVEKNKSSLRLSDSETVDMGDAQTAAQSASNIWMSFVEQATSEVPSSLLPGRIREFFNSDTDTLICSQRIPPVHSIPCFSIHMDGNFDHDKMIISCAAAITRNVIQQFVQLIHQETHVTHNEPKFSIENEGKTQENNSIDHGVTHKHDDATEYPAYHVAKIPQQPHSRSPKGNANLLLAIRMLGYQILRYPHFAVLCWVTSKLKEGPCTDIREPWKGWPFNSCLICPGNSSDRAAVASSSGNIKSKELSGLVRGLIAVGLSAYRGIYKSPREVSSELHLVLELLVGQINSRILAGKESYLRLLSQVAYLEDMVDSWVYTLQSLERDASVTFSNSVLTTVGDTSTDNPGQTDECRSNIISGNSPRLKVLDESIQGFADVDKKGLDLNTKDDDVGFAINEERGPVPGGSEEQGFLSDPTPPPIDRTSCDSALPMDMGSAAADKVGEKILDEHNRICHFESFGSKEPGNDAPDDRVSGPRTLLDGFASSDAVDIVKDGPLASGESGGNMFSSSNKAFDQFNGSANETGTYLRDDKHDSDTNVADCILSSSSTKDTACEQKGSAGHLTELKHQDIENLFLDNEPSTYQQEDSGSMSFLPIACSCHSTGKTESTFLKPSPDPWLSLVLKFIYIDNVLVPVEPETDVSFHCGFETLCLCSFIEWIIATKQPL